MLLAIAIFFCVTAIQGASLAQQDAAANSCDQTNVCLSEHCIEASNRLFKSMNLSADPCNDFSQFACGRFEKEFILPEDKTRWTGFTPVTELIYERGRILLEEPEGDDDWSVVKKAKRMYKSCLNVTRLDELGVAPIKSILKGMGGWPVLEGDAWSGEEKFRWYDRIYEMNRQGFARNQIVSLEVGTDDKNSSWRVVFLDQPNLGMSREYLVKGFDDKDVQHYFTYMKETAALLGAVDADKVAAELKESLLFELQLANISAPREERRNQSRLYNPFLVGQYPSLAGHPPSWAEYLSKILMRDIGPDEKIVVNNPAYIQSLSELIEKTKPRVIANFLGWHAVLSRMEYLDEAAREVRYKFFKATTGLATPPPRWKVCAEEVGFNSKSGLKIVAGSMYVRNHFSVEAKLAMIDMIRYIKNAFAKILQDLTWMDASTKEKAQQKLSQMHQFIAYPDELLDQNVVEKHHEGIEINEDDFIGNGLRVTLWERQYRMGLLREKVNKTAWVDHSTVALANAFYRSNENSIQFPAGVLQGIFFNHLVPKYLTFGAIGGVIGHEITHGFDDQGRQFDAEGNIHNWWEGETQAKFIEKAKCIVDQYSAYNSTQVGLNLNGNATQGENIADNGAAKEAYMAYGKWPSIKSILLTLEPSDAKKKWAQDNGAEEASLPGINFTPRQLFYISWGQIWCSKYRNAFLKQQILTGAHSPGQFRIIGPLSNSPQFSEAFSCPLGSVMNPKDKCTVW